MPLVEFPERVPPVSGHDVLLQPPPPKVRQLSVRPEREVLVDLVDGGEVPVVGRHPEYHVVEDAAPAPVTGEVRLRPGRHPLVPPSRQEVVRRRGHEEYQEGKQTPRRGPACRRPFASPPRTPGTGPT